MHRVSLVTAGFLLVLWTLPTSAEKLPPVPPEAQQQCEAICLQEMECATLPAAYEGKCMNLCMHRALRPEIRSCMAEAKDCQAFSSCTDEPPKSEAGNRSETETTCNVNTPMSCPGVSGGCAFQEVCCTQIYATNGTETVHVCGQRNCPWWSFGLGPFCGCPSESDAWGSCEGVCPGIDSCGEISGTVCGWCESSGQAYVGTTSGPNGSYTCESWIWDHDDCP